MKNLLTLTLLGMSVLAAGCGGGRKIYRVAGCDSRLANPEKRQACRACVARPRPHVYLADDLPGERCVAR